MHIEKYFGQKHHQGDIGIEVEVEAREPLPLAVGKDWEPKAEGSLRLEGMEYVSKTATYNNAAKFKKLHSLETVLKPYKPIQDSPRTSVHVHVNVQKHTLKEVYTAVCAYWLLENVLTKFCGEEYREGNHFCLRAIDAESVVKYAARGLREENHFYPFVNDEGRALRYSALNLAAIPTFGSLEFRAMRGTTDAQLIDLWSSELHYLCSAAKKKFRNPALMMDNYFHMNKAMFMNHFFSKNFVRTLMQYKHWEELIEENEGLVCELAYAADWDTVFEKIVPRAQQRRNRAPRFRPVPMGGLVWNVHGAGGGGGGVQVQPRAVPLVDWINQDGHIVHMPANVPLQDGWQLRHPAEGAAEFNPPGEPEIPDPVWIDEQARMEQEIADALMREDDDL